MKKYPYNEDLFTIRELEKHKDCKVTSRELRKNIWKSKMSVEKAMVTPAPFVESPHLPHQKRWAFHGLELTLSELSDLQECKVSYYRLSVRLRQGIPVALAFQPGKIDFETQVSSPPEVLKSQTARKHNNLRFVKRYKKSFPGSISFKPPQIRKTQTHTYEWLVCEKLGLEMDDYGVDMERYVDKWINCH